jgi:hypothetical protein
VEHTHADEFAYLDVSHMTVLFNNYFEVLVPVADLPIEVVAEVKRQILSYLREIKTVRDPLSHPSDPDLDAFDALRVVDNAVRVLRQTGLSAEALDIAPERSELAARAGESSGSLASDASLAPNTLPSRDEIVVDFIGRRAELGRLWEWLVDPQGRRWLLTGEGGKGKSSIAYQFACEVSARRDTELAGVYWLGAKRLKFFEGKAIPTSGPDFWDLESAVNRLLTELGWSDNTVKPLETKKILLCQLVKEFPCLIVVDDIDSIPADQEDAVEFLVSDLPAAGAKVLFTSRRRIFGVGKSYREVSGLPADDAEAFIDSRLELFGLDPKLMKSDYRSRIITVCEGGLSHFLLAGGPSGVTVRTDESRVCSA